MKTLRKEIEDSLKYRLNDYNTLYYKDITNDILKLFEKRIDSIPYASGMEYHCIAAVGYAKDKMKEMLK